MLPANATSKLQPMDQGIINNVKALYRNKVLSKLICSLDRGADSTVTLLDALHYINAAWDEIFQTTIRKCFQKCGIGKDSEQCASDTPVQSEIQQQLQLLQDSGVTGLEDITPEDYITVDSEVVVAEELMTESIVAQVRYKNSDEYEDDENDGENDVTEEAPAVTLSDTLASINKVQRYFQAQEGTAQFFAGINTLEKFMEKQMLPSRQTMITDYFLFR